MRPRWASKPRPPDYASGALLSELPGPTSPLPAITYPGDCCYKHCAKFQLKNSDFNGNNNKCLSIVFQTITIELLFDKQCSNNAEMPIVLLLLFDKQCSNKFYYCLTNNVQTSLFVVLLLFHKQCSNTNCSIVIV